jgi:hypothetical protein
VSPLDDIQKGRIEALEARVAALEEAAAAQAGPRPNAVVGLVGRILAGENATVTVVLALAAILDETNVLKAPDFARKLEEYAAANELDAPGSMAAARLRVLADAVTDFAARCDHSDRVGSRSHLRLVTAVAPDPGSAAGAPLDSADPAPGQPGGSHPGSTGDDDR